MGEWIILKQKPYRKMWRTIKWKLNTRDYGRVKLLFIHSSRFRNRHIKYKLINA